MLSDYQLKIADLCNIPIGSIKKLVPNLFDKKNFNVKKSVPNFFDQEKVLYKNLQLYLGLGLKLKKSTPRIRIQSMTIVKTIY